jgi:hypothetical protein
MSTVYITPVPVRSQRLRQRLVCYNSDTLEEMAIDAVQRSVKVISIVTSTGTGWPCRVPGRNRHCPAAFTAS